MNRKIYTKYELSKNVKYQNGIVQYKLTAKIGDGWITLKPATLSGKHDKFWFEKSTPETISAIADLMKEAVKLSKQL